MQPLLSIIIANYNYGRFVGQAIDSALAQAWEHKEVIVVDDGSTDESRQVIEPYGRHILPIFKDNGGHGSAFNAGFTRSRGEVVIFLDSDDMLLRDAGVRAIQMLNDKRVSQVHWPMEKINAAGKRTGERIQNAPLADGNIRDFVI